jgi:hypothetical protein
MKLCFYEIHPDTHGPRLPGSRATLPGSTHPPADDWKPATSNQPGKEYPQVNSEGRVKFRIVAPEARSVGVTFRDSSPFRKVRMVPGTAHAAFG